MVAREAALLVSVFSAGVSMGFGGVPPAVASHLAARLRPAANPPPVADPAPADPSPAAVATPARAQDALGVRESTQLHALRSPDFEPFGNVPDADAEPSRATPDVSLCGAGAERRVCSADEPAGGDDTSWLVGLRAPDLPVHASVRVERFLKYLTGSADGRKLFRKWYRRSGLYHDAITRALRDRGLPEDLEAMVYVESGYSPEAVSSTGATGLWQFMPGTARVYGLAVDRDYDERRSVERSTDAATRYLSDLYDRFGSWELALAAYDMGYGKLTQRVQDLSSNDYWTLSTVPGALPDETLGYVPKVLAVALVLRNMDRFGFDDAPIDAPVAASDLEVPGGTALSLVARAAGTSVRSLRALNPEILVASVPDRGAPLSVHVPSSGLARANAMLPRLLSRQSRMDPDEHVSDAFDWGTDEHGGDEAATRSPRVPVFYSVGQRDTLASIANRFSIGTAEILADNRLDPVAKLQKGMLLQLHVPRAALRTLVTLRQEDDRSSPPDAAGLSGQGKP
jgi:membrane-bound lytic murein transglycosylase D